MNCDWQSHQWEQRQHNNTSRCGFSPGGPESCCGNKRKLWSMHFRKMWINWRKARQQQGPQCHPTINQCPFTWRTYNTRPSTCTRHSQRTTTLRFKARTTNPLDTLKIWPGAVLGLCNRHSDASQIIHAQTNTLQTKKGWHCWPSALQAHIAAIS